LIFQQPFLQHHGVATGNLGLWQAPVRGAGIVAALLAHQFVSRMGQRGAFFALPLCLGISNIALAGIDHAWAASAFLGMGIVAGLQPPIVATYINKRIPSERRATILSVQSVVASGVLAIGEPISGLIADKFGLRPMFFAFGVSIMLIAVPLLLLWQRAEQDEQDLDTLDRDLLGRDRREVLPIL
jgi:MFS family permease